MSLSDESAETGVTDASPRRIARILPLIGVPHLDRLFDYEVPAAMDSQAQPGTRVRIRFAGRLIDGFVIERRKTTNHVGKLAEIKRLISPIKVLPRYLWELVDMLAQRSSGTRADILRSAIPPRHANAEKAGLFAGGKDWPDLRRSLEPVEEVAARARLAANQALSKYKFGDRFLTALIDEDASPRMSLLSVPGDDDARLAAVIAASVAWSGKGVLIVAPNVKVVNRINIALERWLDPHQITSMTAQDSSHVRYRRFLSIVEGQARVVVGTRSAVFSPIQDLSAIILLGEADDSLVDPRAPYLHARDVARQRVKSENLGLAVIGPHRSAEIQQWVEEGDVASIHPLSEKLQAQMPWIRGLGDSDAQRERESHAPGSRLPSIAFEAIRESLDRDLPALVQVPRRGYAPALACATCRTPARCRVCNGPLELPRGDEHGVPTCRWCGHLHGQFTCQVCGKHALRMSIVGHGRTAEEIGRAFPGVSVVLSGGDQVKETVPSARRIVVATPGAEPVVVTDKGRSQGLYGALVIVDPWIPLTRADLRAEENALRQWMEAAVLVCPRDDGGRVVIAGSANLNAIQEMIRWNPAAAAQRELATRREAQLPPAVVVAAIDGTADSLAQLEESWDLPPSASLLGPVELPAGVRLPAGLDQKNASQARRLLVRVPHADGMVLGGALKAASAVRTSRRHTSPLRVVMDPVRIG